MGERGKDFFVGVPAEGVRVHRQREWNAGRGEGLPGWAEEVRHVPLSRFDFRRFLVGLSRREEERNGGARDEERAAGPPRGGAGGGWLGGGGPQREFRWRAGPKTGVRLGPEASPR